MRTLADNQIESGADHADLTRVQLATDACVEVMRTSYQTQVFPKHTHDYFTVGVGLGGTGTLWLHGCNHVRRRGDLVLIAPDEVHTGGPAPGSPVLSYLAVHVPPSVLATCAEAHGIRGGSVANIRSAIIQDPAISNGLLRLDAVMRTSRSPGELAQATAATHAPGHRGSPLIDAAAEDGVVSCLALCLALLVSRYAEAARPSAAPGAAAGEPTVVRIAREIIDDCYADGSQTSLGRLSARCGVTPFHLVRLFTRSVGLSPHRYVVQVRVQRARDLLARGVAPSFVAAMTGFADQSHLTTQFKRYVGTTPAFYQRCLAANASSSMADSYHLENP